MKKAKRTLCRALALLQLFAFITAFSACAGHSHTGVLTALRTDTASGVPCCGVFQCTECGETYEAGVTYRDVGLPVVRIEGDLEGISKENKKTATVIYDGDISFTSRATLKWQGESSLLYPKKNFSLQFTDAHGTGKKIMLRDAWGKQSKYCLKANWDDYAGARNLVSAKLWGEIVHSRKKNDRLDPLVNGGAVDGYPVLLYINGEYQGTYTMNTPKNRWIFGMTKKDTRAGLLFAEYWRDAVTMHKLIDRNASVEESGWEVEYCATEDTDEGTAWLYDGMNDLIGFLLEGDDTQFKTEIRKYTDVDRVIDYMLFIHFICGADNLGRNMLWATFDGKKYVPSAYDLDSTWRLTSEADAAKLGLNWNDGSILRTHLLFDRIMDHFENEIRARYAALRESIFTYGHIEKLFSDFLDQAPEILRAAESERWPGQSVVYNNLPQDFTRFFMQRAAALDAYYGFENQQ
ncbi:MAG: CotH kinase family protein [Clostridia bacterium]|nr:CotH kinase family protein [Clostridia bacterium]